MQQSHSSRRKKWKCTICCNVIHYRELDVLKVDWKVEKLFVKERDKWNSNEARKRKQDKTNKGPGFKPKLQMIMLKVIDTTESVITEKGKMCSLKKPTGNKQVR